jgi:hypothetical protein
MTISRVTLGLVLPLPLVAVIPLLGVSMRRGCFVENHVARRVTG